VGVASSTSTTVLACTEPGPPALGIDAHAQQVYEANLETLTASLTAGDDHDNP
jgi:hypothetical protein